MSAVGIGFIPRIRGAEEDSGIVPVPGEKSEGGLNGLYSLKHNQAVKSTQRPSKGRGARIRSVELYLFIPEYIFVSIRCRWKLIFDLLRYDLRYPKQPDTL